MSFGNSMSCKRMSWRLLPSLAALLWVVGSVGFGGVAHADTSTDSTAATQTGSSRSHESQHPGALQPGSSESSGSSRSDGRAGPSSDVTGPQSTHSPRSKPKAATGDLTSPQPISQADANAGGANGQCPGGPYCSTRDGSASHNGNQVGRATGKPCAGCVGKADNKNPRGQMPNASDANAGYECDVNHGIAQGNPAHTACVSGPQEGCVPTETVPCVPPECVPTETVPCVSPPECVPTQAVPCVPVTTVEPPLPPANQAVVAPPALASPSAAALPDTGAAEDLAWLAGAALLSIAGGAALATSRRHRVGS
jgi:LPXTG-motif cell wall-anchored protein